MMKFKPPPKRKKVDPAPSSSFSSSHCTPGVPLGAGLTPTRKSTVLETQSSNANSRIQQARNNALAEAQQDGCTGNFKIFDSSFGNYLVPVIPTRAELGG